MSYKKGQNITIVFFIGLLALLYFGCDTKTKEHKDLEKSRVENFELVNIRKIIGAEKKKLSANAKSDLLKIEQAIEQSANDSLKIEGTKSLASFWYSVRQPLISGHYAEKIANSTNKEDSWSIAGTTLSLAAQQATNDTLKNYAIDKARKAYETALSINSDNVDNKINLALSYVDVMDKTNPMKGILMLRDLSTEYPENPSVLFQLGRLALGTNQLDKAVERLSKAVELKPDFKSAYCLLAESLSKLGEKGKAAEAQIKCDTN